ncbi:MAG: hypothetical protein WBL21_13970 [Salinimicrobium sp.]
MNILYEILVVTVFSLVLPPQAKLEKSVTIHQEQKIFLEGSTGIWYDLKETTCINNYEIGLKNVDPRNSDCCFL